MGPHGWAADLQTVERAFAMADMAKADVPADKERGADLRNVGPHGWAADLQTVERPYRSADGAKADVPADAAAYSADVPADAAAIAVASRGGSVLLASRTQAKLDSAADDIRREVPDAQLTTRVLDARDEAAVKAFGEELEGRWDALICTSQAARSVVEGFLERQEDWLRRHNEACRFERPQLPVIPVGTHTDRWAPPLNKTAACRESRPRHGIRPEA